MSAASSPAPTSRLARRLVAAVVGAGLLVGAASGAASAKEVTSGPTGTAATTTCSPVSSLTYRGDARVGETGVSSITISYGVKPCDKNPVIVDVRLYLSADPTAVAYDNPAAALDGKITVGGVKVNTSYTAKVSVYDAATGTLVGSQQIFAAAKTKPV